MNIDGLDALLNQFHDMKTNIDDDVDDILQENANKQVFVIPGNEAMTPIAEVL
ncbi:hypothetical protein JGE67_25735 [Salmonella enterica subsp. enterica serovar Typhimurium]|nr:hypothetical protein [Salmonella enterica subsp. enterica serovar Typhimurium]